MKARISGLNHRQRQQADDVIDAEIKKQIVERGNEFGNDLDAIVLYVLHTQYGFGKKRLRKFYDTFISEYDKLVKHYQMPGDGVFIARLKLKEIGVDVSQWDKERSNNNETENK